LQQVLHDHTLGSRSILDQEVLRVLDGLAGADHDIPHVGVLVEQRQYRLRRRQGNEARLLTLIDEVVLLLSALLFRLSEEISCGLRLCESFVGLLLGANVLQSVWVLPLSCHATTFVLFLGCHVDTLQCCLLQLLISLFLGTFSTFVLLLCQIFHLEFDISCTKQ